MKLGVYWDLRSTDPVRHTGVGKHVFHVLRYLAEADGVGVHILLARDQQALWATQARHFALDGLPLVSLPLTNKAYRFFHAFTPFPRLKAWLPEFDLVYSPMELLLRTGSVPFINTIHGVPCFEREVPPSVFRSRVYRSERLKQRWFLIRSRRYARSSLVVSEYLARRVHEISGIQRSRLPIVGNGVDDFFFAKPSTPPLAENKDGIRLLVVGGANVFDGAPHVLRTAQLLLEKRPSARIRIIGDRHESPWREAMQKCANVEWTGFLGSQQVCAEMRAATALLYLPTVESFGIIGAEALAAGLPILAHRSTALPEVLGDAALWIDPTATDAELLSAFDTIVMNGALRQKLIESGQSRARLYRWETVGERVRKQLKMIVEQS